MNAGKTSAAPKTNTKKTLDKLFPGVKVSRVWFFVLIPLWLVTYFCVVRTSQSYDVIIVMGQSIPLRSFTGAFSAIGNLCIILLVVFYKKPGFFVSIAFLLWQFPSVLMGIFLGRNFSSIPGLFVNLLSVLTVLLLYRNNCQIDSYQVKLRDLASTDALTGLPNRFASSELVSTLVANGEKFAVAVLNLNNFKRINNIMGPGTGNRVLREIAARWQNAADSNLSGTQDFVSCQGGDEFLLIVRGYDSEAQLLKTVECYKSLLEEKITVDDCDYYLNASIGYAEFPRDAQSADILLARANAAMYDSKRHSGERRICRFSENLADTERALDLERKIRFALENDTLYYVLQPQFDIAHRLSGFEALARMRDAEGNIISPTDFIPIAERIGLIDQIDHAVFEKSACDFGRLIRETNTGSTLCVNISVRHLMRNDFLDEVRDVLAKSGVPAGQLELEITESIMIDSVDKALRCINDIRQMGVKIAIDDFGTGYSSLSYLNSFPADLLKVDKSFIDQMNSNESSKQYVAAIISIGHVMNFAVISEGVEKPEQLETLRAIGCDYIQGFIWGRPMSPESARELVMSSMNA